MKVLEKYAAGFSGMFYSIVEKSLIQMYKEYEEEQKRKRQMSKEEAKDEEQLVAQIEVEAHKDVEFMASFQHSKYYNQ